MMRKIAIAALIALAVGPALAQSPPAGTPTRIRGTVDKLDGQNLLVKSRDGQTLTIELAVNVAVIALTLFASWRSFGFYKVYAVAHFSESFPLG